MTVINANTEQILQIRAYTLNSYHSSKLLKVTWEGITDPIFNNSVREIIVNITVLEQFHHTMFMGSNPLNFSTPTCNITLMLLQNKLAECIIINKAYARII